jgi:hypothetical protein
VGVAATGLPEKLPHPRRQIEVSEGFVSRAGRATQGQASVDAAPPMSWSPRVAGGVGTGPIGMTGGDIGIGGTAFPNAGNPVTTS